MDRVVNIQKRDAEQFVHRYLEMWDLPPTDNIDATYDVAWLGLRNDSLHAVVGLVDSGEMGTYVHMLMHDGSAKGLRAMIELTTYLFNTIDYLWLLVITENHRMIRFFTGLGAQIVGPMHGELMMRYSRFEVVA